MGELGRQVKRIKTSTILNNVIEMLSIVPNDMIDLHFSKAVDMVVEMAVNNLGEHPRHRELLIAVTNAIQQVVNKSCAPGGAISNLLVTACQPRGVVRTCVDVSVAAAEQRSMARLHNSTKHGGAKLLQVLLGLDNAFPDNFPRSYEDFAGMSLACADSLLLSYGLSPNRTTMKKLKRLSAYCNVNLPK